MRVMYFSNGLCVCSEIIFLRTLNYATFRKDNLSKKKFPIQEIYAIVVRYWWFRQMNSFLGRKGRAKTFQIDILQTDWD